MRFIFISSISLVSYPLYQYCQLGGESVIRGLDLVAVVKHFRPPIIWNIDTAESDPFQASRNWNWTRAEAHAVWVRTLKLIMSMKLADPCHSSNPTCDLENENLKKFRKKKPSHPLTVLGLNLFQNSIKLWRKRRNSHLNLRFPFLIWSKMRKQRQGLRVISSKINYFFESYDGLSLKREIHYGEML